MMYFRLSTSIVLALACAPSALSFTVPLMASPSFVGSRAPASFLMRNHLTPLSMSADNEESDAPSTTKRRKRKDGKNAATVQIPSEPELTAQITTAPEPTVQIPTEPEPVVEVVEVMVAKPEPVQMKVQDIRDLVAGRAPEMTPEPIAVDEKVDDDELEDDEEYEYYYEDEDDQEVVVASYTTKENSLEDLLADARKMRETEEPDAGPSIPAMFKSVVSTIVTIDFFVVCGLLAWFLAGIFCSYIIKDDTVQIAFNGQFEAVVQPALGILMIGSVAGSFGGEPEKD
jgi:hypothetical protein